MTQAQLGDKHIDLYFLHNTLILMASLSFSPNFTVINGLAIELLIYQTLSLSLSLTHTTKSKLEQAVFFLTSAQAIED